MTEAPRHRVRLAPGLEAIPVVHGRLEFAAAVRAELVRDPPDVVAVELPATLERLVRRAVGFLPALTVVSTRHEDGKAALLFVSPQAPMMEALRTAEALGLEVAFVDQDVEGYPDHLEDLPDPWIVRRIGAAGYHEQVAPSLPVGDLDRTREATMAHHLLGLAEAGKRVVFVGGLRHVEGLRALCAGPRPPRPLARVQDRPGAVFEVHPESVERLQFLGEAPYAIAAHELLREDPAALPPDRLALVSRLLEAAGAHYEGKTGEELTPRDLRVLEQYARNLAHLRGGLVPDLLELLAAARGAVDDNYAHAVMELATQYPFRAPEGKLPLRRVTPEDLEWMRTRFLRVHPRIRQVRPRPSSLSLRRRPRERREGEWKEGWDRRPEGLCSYPPEDVVIEAYGERLKDRARAALTEAARRSRPFDASLLDGVDVRETIRNWHEGRIYVRSEAPVRGDVGSIVVIFDPDPARYPWTMTWWGEHEQESDMAFYATDPRDQAVGPGIARAEYGGYLMSYPPGRLADVWTDPYYQVAETAAERLLMAGLEYSEERFVAYVAARPPRSRMHSVAERFDRRIVYLPLGTLPSSVVKKLRVFHVLKDASARAEAHRYVW